MELRTFRESMGWTLADMAGFVGVANAKVVQRHEEGSRMPRPEIIEKYGKISGGKITADDFVATHRRWKKAQERQARAEAA